MGREEPWERQGHGMPRGTQGHTGAWDGMGMDGMGMDGMGDGMGMTHGGAWHGLLIRLDQCIRGIIIFTITNI